MVPIHQYGSLQFSFGCKFDGEVVHNLLVHACMGLHTYRCLGRGLHVEYHDVDTISEAAPSSHLVQSHVCQLVVQVGQHGAWHFATLHHWDLGSDQQWLGGLSFCPSLRFFVGCSSTSPA
jgi:hypothetical protein